MAPMEHAYPAQAIFVAVSAYLHCAPERGDAAADALVATLRKRLSLAFKLEPLHAQRVQVWAAPRPSQVTLPNLLKS